MVYVSCLSVFVSSHPSKPLRLDDELYGHGSLGHLEEAAKQGRGHEGVGGGRVHVNSSGQLRNEWAHSCL